MFDFFRGIRKLAGKNHGDGNTPSPETRAPEKPRQESHSSSTYSLQTRGPEYRRKDFRYSYCPDRRRLLIENSENRVDTFDLDELVQILEGVRKNFGNDWCPLANNVEKLGKGTERMGLGVIIMEGVPGSTSHAQASSYLGAVFEDLGLFEWNGVERGIEWRLLVDSITADELHARLCNRVEETTTSE